MGSATALPRERKLPGASSPKANCCAARRYRKLRVGTSIPSWRPSSLQLFGWRLSDAAQVHSDAWHHRRDQAGPGTAVAGANTAEHVREGFKLLRHHMNDVALALHATDSTNCNTRKPATRSRGVATVWYRFNQTALFPDRRPLPLASEPSFVETKKERRKGPDDDVARCLRGTRAAPKIARGTVARCGNPCCVRTVGRGLRRPAHRGAKRAVN